MKPQIHRIKLGINSCYLIREKSVIMIDGGNPGKLKAFQKKISDLGISPEEIKLIILTHSHFAHRSPFTNYHSPSLNFL
ncbi:MAG: MBL fold metallo-hydrolase [Bacteroidota bacterium]